MSSKLPLSFKYISFAAIYGAARKIWYLRNMEYKIEINDKIETRPILYTHYVMFGIMHGFIGIYYLPFHILNDLEKIESYCRNIKQLPKKTNKTNKTVEFMDLLIDYHY